MTQPGAFFGSREVSHSSEFDRVDRLPRRTWTESEGQALAERLTAILRTPGGSMVLEPVQAVMLRDSWQARGLFAPAGVGSGKTLASLLIPRVVKAERPILIIDAGLDNPGRKTEVLEYAKHWAFQLPEVVHFQALQTVKGKFLLDEMWGGLGPTDVIIDESHLFKNPRTARTARFDRFVKSHPQCRIYAMTGTIMKREIEDFCHVVRWCLGPGAPVPLVKHVIEEWGNALNETLNLSNRCEPGPLLNWSSPAEIAELGTTKAARRGFCRRLLETPGVVGYSLGADKLKARVVIDEIRLETSPAVMAAFEGLRSKMVLPDDEELVEALEITRHARTFPLGYYLKWRYPAPLEWLAKRRAANAFLRQELSRSRKLDSPKEVFLAYPDAPELREWQAIKDSYEPETVPEWICGRALARYNDWLKEPGVAFVENTVFGRALAAVAKVPYFGAGGLDASGRSIEHYQGRSCVAGIDSNGKGRNLQHKWSRMLLTMPTENGPQGQQVIGRMQRLGQKSDLIHVQVGIGAIEHLKNFWQTWADANAASDTVGTKMIILGAEINMTRLGDEPTTAEYDKLWGRALKL